ncbi:MAG: hypothetical protein ACYDB7_12410 [Mycobacteriales bacterium]
MKSAALFLPLLLASACSAQALGGTPGGQIATLPPSTLPASIGGLTVAPENVTKALSGVAHSYVNGLGFFSLRKGTQVEATLELARLGPAAPLTSSAFRTEISNQVSVATPVTLDVAGSSVAQSTGPKSTVTVWYAGRDLVVLTVLNSYPQGRGLLEAALGAVPAS